MSQTWRGCCPSFQDLQGAIEFGARLPHKKPASRPLCEFARLQPTGDSDPVAIGDAHVDQGDGHPSKMRNHVDAAMAEIFAAELRAMSEFSELESMHSPPFVSNDDCARGAADFCDVSCHEATESTQEPQTSCHSHQEMPISAGSGGPEHEEADRLNERAAGMQAVSASSDVGEEQLWRRAWATMLLAAVGDDIRWNVVMDAMAESEPSITVRRLLSSNAGR